MTAIVAEILPDADAPQVGVTVTDLEAGDQVVSVQVSWDNGETWKRVSGGDHVVGVGGVFVRDHFPPLNLSARWRVIEHSVSGEPTTESEDLTVASATSWLQNPLDPHDAVALTGHWPDDDESIILSGSFAAAVYSQSVEYTQVLGADRPVASVGQRQVAGEVPLSVAHAVASEGGRLRRLLKSGGSLVLRMDRPTVLDPVTTIAVGDAKENISRPASTGQISSWELTVTQVRALSLRFVVPWWTYDQVKALWPATSYDAIDAARPGDTYLEWRKDPTP